MEAIIKAKHKVPNYQAPSEFLFRIIHNSATIGLLSKRSKLPSICRGVGHAGGGKSSSGTTPGQHSARKLPRRWCYRAAAARHGKCRAIKHF